MVVTMISMFCAWDDVSRRRLQGALVRALAVTDEAIDLVLYRPAVVKAFIKSPRWWQCDLARFSMRLDDRWQTHYWDDAGIAPGGWCEACGRRAAIHVVGGRGDESEDTYDDFLSENEVHLCGWCRLDGQIDNGEDLRRELALAADRSIAWRWR